MSTIPKKISELPLITQTANNTVTVVSQSAPGGSMTTYKISVNDLIKSSQFITSKVDKTDFNDLEQRVSDTELVIANNLASLPGRVLINEDKIATLEVKVARIDDYISPNSGIRYTNYVLSDGKTVKIEL